MDRSTSSRRLPTPTVVQPSWLLSVNSTSGWNSGLGYVLGTLECWKPFVQLRRCSGNFKSFHIIFNKLVVNKLGTQKLMDEANMKIYLIQMEQFWSKENFAILFTAYPEAFGYLSYKTEKKPIVFQGNFFWKECKVRGTYSLIRTAGASKMRNLARVNNKMPISESRIPMKISNKCQPSKLDFQHEFNLTFRKIVFALKIN